MHESEPQLPFPLTPPSPEEIAAKAAQDEARRLASESRTSELRKQARDNIHRDNQPPQAEIPREPSVHEGDTGRIPTPEEFRANRARVYTGPIREMLDEKRPPTEQNQS